MNRNVINFCRKCTTFLTYAVKRKYCSMNANIEILQDIFGIPHNEAKKYISHYKLKNSGELLESINSCRKLGYTDKDILNNPSLLRVRPVEIIQHYLALEEGGFSKITARSLATARTLMKKSIYELKMRELIPEEKDVASCFIEYIDPKPRREDFEFTQNSQWREIKRKLTEVYLKMRLQASENDIIKFFRIHHPTKYKSFRVIRENIELAESLGFSSEKILRNGYLLHNYPEYPKEVLREFPSLVGVDTRTAMWRFPKLMTVRLKNIIQIYGILKSYNIPDEAIKPKLEIFTMSPDTIKLRLEEIQQTPEFRILLDNPKIVTLLLYHNKSRSRLNFLQHLKLKCASAQVLQYRTTDEFDQYIKEGKDVNTPKDVLVFMKNLFKVPEAEIKEILKKHPFRNHVPLVRMEETFRYLTEKKYNRCSILKACYILLYPKEKIEQAIKELSKHSDICFVKLSKVHQLNLILYHIEKEHHFTGNGIWRKSDIMDVPERTLE